MYSLHLLERNLVILNGNAYLPMFANRLVVIALFTSGTQVTEEENNAGILAESARLQIGSHSRFRRTYEPVG
jgi:hypothetical protein